MSGAIDGGCAGRWRAAKRRDAAQELVRSTMSRPERTNPSALSAATRNTDDGR